MKFIRSLDTVAATVLLVGTVTDLGLELANKRNQKNARPRAGRLLLGSFAGAALYQAARTYGFKTAEERRIAHTMRLYAQAEAYRNQATTYGRAAAVVFKRFRKSLRTAISS